jgi:hypothetical protein
LGSPVRPESRLVGPRCVINMFTSGKELLQLPSEVLQIIYSHDTEDVVVRYRPREAERYNPQVHGTADTPGNLSMLFVCKSQHKAFWWAMPRHSTITIDSCVGMRSFVFHREEAALIRHLKLEHHSQVRAMGLYYEASCFLVAKRFFNQLKHVESIIVDFGSDQYYEMVYDPSQ